MQLVFPNVDLDRMFPFEDCDNTDRTERSLSEYVITQIELREVYLKIVITQIELREVYLNM